MQDTACYENVLARRISEGFGHVVSRLPAKEMIFLEMHGRCSCGLFKPTKEMAHIIKSRFICKTG